MKTFTVCLYDGAVTYIDKVVAAKTIEEENIDGFDHIALFYDVIEKSDSYTEYQNRITKKNFKVYYERTILFSDEIHSYDFGSYSRFITIVEGNHEKDIKEYFNEKVK